MPLDAESRSPHVRGFVIEELSEIASNWRSEISLDEYLRHWKIPGIQGIDTRALTRHLRTRGAMKACLTTEEISAEEAVRRAIEGEGVIGMDYVREVTAPAAYQWDPDDQAKRRLGDREQQEQPLCRQSGIGSWPMITASRKTSCAGCARMALG